MKDQLNQKDIKVEFPIYIREYHDVETNLIIKDVLIFDEEQLINCIKNKKYDKAFKNFLASKI